MFHGKTIVPDKIETDYVKSIMYQFFEAFFISYLYVIGMYIDCTYIWSKKYFVAQLK
jgi:hypothetical protein